MAKGKVLETVVNIAGEISPTLGKTIKGVTDKLSGVNVAALAAGASIAAIGAAAVTGAVQAGKYLAGLGDDYNKAVNDMAAQTGLTGAALDAMADSMQNIYAMNLGESMEDVADSMATVQRNTDLTGDALEAVTADALALRDTFDYDVAESTRAAQALMENFGLSGERAMDYIVTGAQNGLDFSGEMLDSISEYSVQFAKIGLDANDMFNILQSGADGTAWNLDKVGDAIKEFSIRSIDGSKTTIEGFKAIGMNAEDMMQTFANGGDEASSAFYDVLDALMAMEDPVARDAAGVNLFGTMWEDMGVEAMQALADAERGAYAAGDAMESLMEVKYDNLEDAFGAIKRQAEVALIPLASTFASLLTDLAPKLAEVIKRIAPIIEKVTERAMPFVEEFVGGLLDGLDALSPMIDGLLPVLADTLMDIFEAISPIFPIIAELAKSLLPVIVSLVSALTPIVSAVFEVLMPVISLVSDLVSFLLPPLTSLITALIPLIEFLAAVFSGVLGGAISSLTPIITTIVDVLGSVISFIANVFTGNWEGAWDNIVNIFKNIFNLIPMAIEGIINLAIDLINGIIKGINAVAEHVGFEINLIPHVDLPKFAAGGFTEGLSLAGEAGTEAIISFDPAYREANLGYWAQAGQLLGATAEDAGFELSGDTGESAVVIDMGGITFAPNITINGNADRESIVQAIRDEYPEFMDMLEEFFVERGATVYA